MPFSCYLASERTKQKLVANRLKDINSARCSVCHRSFAIATMGEYALRSHSSSAKHLELMKVRSSEAGIYFSINKSYLQIVSFL